MHAVSTLRDRFEAMRDDGEWGVFVSALALAFLTGGYAVGSVLAGEAVTEQLWALPLFTGCVCVLAMLWSRDEA
ncbi:hypothetical protein [Halobacterium litoreum]|uniref:Uncharacterized protein n=1 Tax=Halobacterium litoreum TaxID=2039234 RepID=A0ABD5NBL3_9EURY|nr:hypothetical protein [Halobacterium litoreum]UHH14620.1 hypothetical protein LT972_06370 [Halobacterium litoreum]